MLEKGFLSFCLEKAAQVKFIYNAIFHFYVTYFFYSIEQPILITRPSQLPVSPPDISAFPFASIPKVM